MAAFNSDLEAFLGSMKSQEGIIVEGLPLPLTRRLPTIVLTLPCQSFPDLISSRTFRITTVSVLFPELAVFPEALCIS